ncbi:hypothetical protein E2P81_ATG10003 [Venturia nashicola]|uniref:Uncharacterized protein n=1 Tax=Venturia nashicola TaxID=86259 RepID=A0A4Z1NGK1_9PEZI|nr:hypothetical protein E6O75_ATG10224 [Venturia nashicola]TLD14822.1 hypothetical protein E2P81_ATG10003 [Venturia nashicola]
MQFSSSLLWTLPFFHFSLAAKADATVAAEPAAPEATPSDCQNLGPWRPTNYHSIATCPLTSGNRYDCPGTAFLIHTGSTITVSSGDSPVDWIINCRGGGWTQIHCARNNAKDFTIPACKNGVDGQVQIVARN